MADVRAGGAYVEIGANKKPFDVALADVQASLASFGSSVSKMGTDMMAIGAAIAGAFVGASKLMVDVASNAVDAATRTGLTITQVQTLGFAAKQAGASFEELENGLKFFQRGLADVARTGQGPAADALRQLGLRAKDLIKLSPQDQIFAVADALSKVENPAIRSNLALDLFSRSGTRLLPMLKEGSAGIRKLQAEAVRLGGVMSEQAAVQAEAFGDRLDALKMSLLGVAVKIGEALLPSLEVLVERVINAVIEIQNWIERNQETVITILKIGLFLLVVGAALWTFGKIVTIVSGIIKAFQVTLLILRTVMGFVRKSALRMWAGILFPIAAVILGFMAVQDVLEGLDMAFQAKEAAALTASAPGQKTETIDTIGGKKIAVSPGGGLDLSSGIGALNNALTENTAELKKMRGDGGAPAGGFKADSATTHDVITRGRAGAAKTAKPRG